jgi:hypothetical protein
VWYPPRPKPRPVPAQRSEPALRAAVDKGKSAATDGAASEEPAASPARKRRRTNKASTPTDPRSTTTLLRTLPPGPNGQPWKHAPTSTTYYAVREGGERVSSLLAPLSDFDLRLLVRCLPCAWDLPLLSATSQVNGGCRRRKARAAVLALLRTQGKVFVFRGQGTFRYREGTRSRARRRDRRRRWQKGR